jgi:hypothetical protein
MIFQRSLCVLLKNRPDYLSSTGSASVGTECIQLEMSAGEGEQS